MSLPSRRRSGPDIRRGIFDRVLHYVVVARHIGRNYRHRASACGHGHRARRVETVADVAQLTDDATAFLIPFDTPLLIADAPHYHRGVVAVAVNHPAQLAGDVDCFFSCLIALRVDEDGVESPSLIVGGGDSIESVGYAPADGDSRIRAVDKGCRDGVVGYVAGCFAVEPCVAVDASAFIEPSFFESGIRTDGNHIVTAPVDIRCDVVGLLCVAARFASEIEAVEPHPAVAEYSVENERQTHHGVLGGHGKYLAIPPDGSFGIFVADGIVAVAVACLACKWQVGHKVMREVDFGPCRVVELHGIRTYVVDRCSFCKVVEIFSA